MEDTNAAEAWAANRILSPNQSLIAATTRTTVTGINVNAAADVPPKRCCHCAEIGR